MNKVYRNLKRIQDLLEQGVSQSKIARTFGVERATLRKYLLRLEETVEGTESHEKCQCFD